MTPEKPISQRNLDRYGAPMIEWDQVRGVLDGDLTQAPGTGGPGRHRTGLATTNPDGTPHVMPVGEIRVEGTWYCTSGPAPASPATSPAIHGAWSAWPPNPSTSRSKAPPSGSASVDGDALTAECSAPSAGPPPWYAYEVVPSRVHAVGTAAPYGAARFDLADAT